LAAGYWADTVEYEWNCTNSGDILGTNDGDHASLGVNGPPRQIGGIIISFEIAAIHPDSTIWIYASSALKEEYRWKLLGNLGSESSWTINCDDTTNSYFDVPDDPDGPGPEGWVEMLIETEDDYNIPDPDRDDPIWGSEIDAVEITI
jgi:hypothetical protein